MSYKELTEKEIFLAAAELCFKHQFSLEEGSPDFEGMSECDYYEYEDSQPQEVIALKYEYDFNYLGGDIDLIDLGTMLATEAQFAE
jgi:hypothetical protein